MTTARYEIKTGPEHHNGTRPWMALASTVTVDCKSVGAQCYYDAATTSPAELEAALEADHDVIEYSAAKLTADTITEVWTMPSILDTVSCVRMTASRAEELIRESPPILCVTIKPVHLDVLQMLDIDLETRAVLATASDDLEAGRLHTDAMRAIVAAYNARCGKQA